LRKITTQKIKRTTSKWTVIFESFLSKLPLHTS